MKSEQVVASTTSTTGSIACSRRESAGECAANRSTGSPRGRTLEAGNHMHIWSVGGSERLVRTVAPTIKLSTAIDQRSIGPLASTDPDAQPAATSPASEPPMPQPSSETPESMNWFSSGRNPTSCSNAKFALPWQPVSPLVTRRPCEPMDREAAGGDGRSPGGLDVGVAVDCDGGEGVVVEDVHQPFGCDTPAGRQSPPPSPLGRL